MAEYMECVNYCLFAVHRMNLSERTHIHYTGSCLLCEKLSDQMTEKTNAEDKCTCHVHTQTYACTPVVRN